MKAYLCSIGEKTTEICKEQLERFGLYTVLLNQKESWQDKYKRFLNIAREDCIRIDADIIPNKNILILTKRKLGIMLKQAYGYDFYRNDIGVIGAVYYSEKALEIIRNNLDKIDWRRPEATAWRLDEFMGKRDTSEKIIGMHGFFQGEDDLKRHEKHKLERKQIDGYDFKLARRLLNLCQKD